MLYDCRTGYPGGTPAAEMIAREQPSRFYGLPRDRAGTPFGASPAGRAHFSAVATQEMNASDGGKSKEPAVDSDQVIRRSCCNLLLTRWVVD
jgi:hypothetical protein